MTHDPYAPFASVYDAWQALYPKPFSLAMAPRIRQSVRELAPPGTVLADAACGTGILAFWWQRTHKSWTVYGTDKSEAMILAARESARKQGKLSRAPEFLIQDLTRFSLPQPAAVVTCLFDSLNHVTRDGDMQKVFRRIHDALLPGGLFLFDLVDELAFPEVFSGSSILNGSALFVGMESAYREERGVGIGHALFTFFNKTGGHCTETARSRRASARGSGRAAAMSRSAPEECWERIEFRVRERRWFRGEIREMLSKAGLDLLKLQRIDPLEHRDFFVPRTYWTCRRPRGRS